MAPHKSAAIAFFRFLSRPCRTEISIIARVLAQVGPSIELL